VEKLADVAGIDPKACSAYQAHVEGRVERRNWLVAMMLREMCKDDMQGWDEYLHGAKDKRPHGIEENDSVYMWIARENKLQQSAIGPMTVKRFLDPEMHPPGQPNETVTVHVDRLIKAHDRPADLVRISPDLADWIEMQGDKQQVPQQETDLAPEVTAAGGKG
jgi:hypothetical protein